MPVRVELGAEAELSAHAKEGYPDEVCGILVGVFAGAEVRVLRARRAPNAAGRDRRSAFFLHPRDLIAAEDELAGSGLEVVGFYHSHPDVPASPSEKDASLAWPMYVHAIASVLQGRVRHVSYWRAADAGLKEEAVIRG